MKLPFGYRLRLIVGYVGHENRLFAAGPHWWQITFPPSRRWRRIALMFWYVG